MHYKEIRHIIKTIFQNINRLLHKIDKEFDVDAIHDFRIQVKALRAFLRLLALEQDNVNDLKLPKKLKNVYTAAGKIRELQLQLLRVKKIFRKEKKPVEYISLLENELQKRIKDFEIAHGKRLPVKTENAIICKLPHQLQPSTISQFCEKNIASINLLLRACKNSDEALHSIRKGIKDILFAFKELREDADMSLLVSLWNKRQLKKAAALTHELGLFNDVRSALSFAGPFYLNEINSKERKQLQAARSKWNLEKKTRKEKITNKIMHAKCINIA